MRLPILAVASVVPAHDRAVEQGANEASSELRGITLLAEIVHPANATADQKGGELRVGDFELSGRCRLAEAIQQQARALVPGPLPRRLLPEESLVDVDHLPDMRVVEEIFEKGF